MAPVTSVLIITAAIFLWGVVAKRLEHANLSAPIVFVAFGALLVFVQRCDERGHLWFGDLLGHVDIGQKVVEDPMLVRMVIGEVNALVDRHWRFLVRLDFDADGIAQQASRVGALAGAVAHRFDRWHWAGAAALREC